MSKIAKSIAVLGVVAGLGVAALPLSTYAADPVESAPVTIRAKVNNSIAISTDGVDLVDFGTISDGSGEQIQTIAVTVSGSVTNYALGVMDYDNDNSMVNVTDDSSTTKIEAIKGTTLTEGWGFRSEDRHVATKDWTPVPVYAKAGVTNLVTTAPLDKTNGSVTNVQFGINIDGVTLDNGTYEDKVIFSAIEASA